MSRYEGECRDGPMAGQRLAHWSRTYEVMRPGLVSSVQPLADDERIPVVVVGRYQLNDFGMWMWHETAEGKAIRTLES